ncbi:MAG: helix-turn-helix domain-containing protein [Clostridium sp.]|nr:helix-turn-helix domain-containing protein [Clostridium sp.]
MRQPIFQLVQNQYQQRGLEGWKGCRYYEMIPLLPPVYIPDGGCELLWDTGEKRLYFLHEDIAGGSFVPKKAELAQRILLPQKRKLLGIHIDFGYRVSYHTEEVEGWWKELEKYDDFAGRAAFCGRSLDQVLRRSSTAFLAGSVLGKMTDARGRVIVENLSVEYHYTSRQMERMFREMYGCTPKKMSQFIRLLSALDMMSVSPELSFSEIALRLGYADTSHFQREFKRFIGVTPGRLREEYMQRGNREGLAGGGQ